MGPDKWKLYRLPWSLNDNPIGWVEVTDICNIHCRGCYRQKMEGHKTFEAIKEEVLFLKKWRNCDNISIAGGEPLIHPQIIEIVEFISQTGMKPYILTNGMALTPELMQELKRAGVVGLGFHVDSLQNRAGWTGKNELELCELRERLARMVADVGDVPCGFGITVYRENFDYIPDLLKWTIKHKKIVQGATFITYRAATVDAEYELGDKSIKLTEETLGYASHDAPADIGIGSADVYELIKKHYPQYDAAAYLGGTQLHSSIKWLAGALVVSGNEVLGHLGPKSLEFAEAMHHLLFGTYMVYRKDLQLGRKALLMGLFDPAMRSALKNYLRKPFNIFNPVYGVSIGIIQAPDMLADGRVDMCDSCPDMTYFNGTLVNSCRLDEYRKFGRMMTGAPKEEQELVPS